MREKKIKTQIPTKRNKTKGKLETHKIQASAKAMAKKSKTKSNRREKPVVKGNIILFYFKTYFFQPM
jgi:hypothetical protein